MADDSESPETEQREPKDQRIPIMMSLSELRAIDDWGFERRIRSRAETIRRLVQSGIAIRPEVFPKTLATLLEASELLNDVIQAVIKGKHIDVDAVLRGSKNATKSGTDVLEMFVAYQSSVSSNDIRQVYDNLGPELEGVKERTKLIREEIRRAEVARSESSGRKVVDTP